MSISPAIAASPADTTALLCRLVLRGAFFMMLLIFADAEMLNTPCFALMLIARLFAACCHMLPRYLALLICFFVIYACCRCCVAYVTLPYSLLMRAIFRDGVDDAALPYDTR